VSELGSDQPKWQWLASPHHRQISCETKSNALASFETKKKNQASEMRLFFRGVSGGRRECGWVTPRQCGKRRINRPSFHHHRDHRHDHSGHLPPATCR
jgi:hypothetical protein